MNAKFDEEPLVDLYKTLREHFRNNIYHDAELNYNSIDSIIRLILSNNGCGFVNDYVPACEVRIIDDYYIYFIKDAKANDANEFYDYIEFMGSKYLVIFLDYFDNIKTKEYINELSMITEKTIEDTMNELMGNSVYFDAIRKIVDIFISTITTPAIRTNILAASAAANKYRWAGVIIAADIINEFNPITENDISGLPFDKVLDLISKNIGLTLNGIHTM